MTVDFDRIAGCIDGSAGTAREGSNAGDDNMSNSFNK
jgi:hypothetical protein